MSCDERTVIAFLFNELGKQERAEFDDHLLVCESCWQAVTEDRSGRSYTEDLGEPAPLGLADRIRLAIETAPKSSCWDEGTRIGGSGVARMLALRSRVWLAAGTVLAVVVVATLTVTLSGQLWSRPPTAPSLGITSAVVELAGGLPPNVSEAPTTRPSPMDVPVVMTLDGAQLTLTYYRVGSGEALVARSERPFGMPMGGRELAGGRAWVALIKGQTVYCANGARSVAIVTPLTLRDAMNLASYLRIPT